MNTEATAHRLSAARNNGAIRPSQRLDPPPAPKSSAAPDPQPPAAAGLEPRLQHAAADLDRSISACLDQPKVDAVHHVRTGSRRLEALIEAELRERSTGSGAMQAGLHRAANTWLRQLKKIRRAAGKVRDLDVHRKIIDQAFLHPQQKPSAKKQAAQGSARSTASAGADRLPKQAETVDHWLKTARKRQQSKLEKTLAKRQPKLTGARQAFLAALPPPEVRATTVGRPIADLARADFDRLLRQMPTLDAGNLHDFRKQAKKARYLAESAGEDDREAHALAEEIKRAQDAIGEWHDWLLLCDESKAALGKHGAQLRKTIAAETNRLFTEALRISTEVRARLTQPPPQTAHPTLSA